MDDLEPATAVEEVFRGNGISVESVSLDDTVSLTYLAAFPDAESDHGEVGRTATSSLGHTCGDEFRPRTVEATVFRNEGGVQAMWTLKADWTRVCNDYVLGDEGLSQCVLDNPYEEGNV